MTANLTRPWLPKQLTRLDEVAALDKNWDSYQGEPPAAAAVAITRSLLHVLSAWHTVSPQRAPQLCPCADGGIVLVWREKGYDLDVNVEPDGRITGWLSHGADRTEVEW